ncbi:MAG: GNAT family N-acetyltransferase [Polyangiaceae bacterium]|nr:GNAT family N-acetyltransferase [Polyangiaceae bacterium]
MKTEPTPSFGDDDELEVTQASSEHGPGLLALFDRCRHPCYCRYWHHEGNNNSWLEQLFQHEEENKTRMLEALEGGSPEMSGMVALVGDSVVGWMKLAPAASVAKVYAQKGLRALPCFNDANRAGVYTVACFLVDPAWRELGVARALLAEGIVCAQELGASSIEAFPCTAADIRPEQLLGGPPSIFVEAGFREVGKVANYPVMRLTF